MALTLPTPDFADSADAYIDLADARKFWSARGNSEWSGLGDTEAEAFIRRATDWVDRSFDFLGQRTYQSGRLKWPRKELDKELDLVIADSDIPWQVREATAHIAELYRQGVFDLDRVITDENSAISRQKVDVIEVQYDTSHRIRTGDVPTHVYELLRPLTTGTALRRA